MVLSFNFNAVFVEKKPLSLLPLPSFEILAAHVRKLPMTSDKAAFLAGDTDFLHHLQLARPDFVTKWQKMCKKIKILYNEKHLSNVCYLRRCEYLQTDELCDLFQS